MQEQIEMLKSINKRLEVIISLMLQQNLSNKKQEEPSMREQIKTLDSLGLTPTEIAKTLNRNSGYINKELSILKKER